MERRTCKSVSLHCCHTTLSSYDMYEEREKTPFAKVFSRSYENIELCGDFSISHLQKKRKREYRGAVNFAENRSLAKCPLFFANYIYFITFFLTLIKEKSGKVGRNPAKSCATTVSGWPLLK